MAVVYGSVDLSLLLRLGSFARSEDVTGEKKGGCTKRLTSDDGSENQRSRVCSSGFA